jgi:tetratricopeptide (TPR) repeat protein
MSIQEEKELSDNARTLWHRARSAVELRNFDYAVALIRTILKDHPAFLDGRKLLRRVEISLVKNKRKPLLESVSSVMWRPGKMDNPKEAIEIAEKSLERDPTNTQINHFLKAAAMAAGLPETAAFALATIIEGHPKDTKAMHELGDLYVKMGLHKEASDMFTKISGVDPSDLAARKKAKDADALSTIEGGKWQEEGGFIGKVKNPTEATSAEQVSRVVKSVEMIDDLLHEMYPRWEAQQDNLDLSRRMAKLWEERLEQVQDLSSLEGALYYYQHAHDLAQGGDPSIARKIAELESKRLDLEVRQLEEKLAQGAGDDIAAWQAELEAARKRKAEMQLEAARKRVERNPTDLTFRFELGELLFLAGRYSDAVLEFQKVRQSPNLRLRAMNLLGQCYVEKGMLDLAVKQFQECVSEISEMNATKKEVLYKLGLVLERMGRKEDSLACFKQIYEIDAGYLDVMKRVEDSYGQA